MTTLDLLNKTLDQMPTRFTSNQFAKKFKRNGGTQQQISSGIIANFLRDAAMKDGSRRSWIKIFEEIVTVDKVDKPFKQIFDGITLMPTEEILKILRNRGYQITLTLQP